jgi:formylglycine-generating enzyme required for sulfatase activity
MDRHVFISYLRDDSAVVDDLITALSGHGYECWRDTERIDGGQLWREAIARGLDAAYAMILVVSPRTEQSKEVYAEFFYADGRGVPVIPLMIGKCDLPFQLGDRNARSWYRDQAQAIQQLRSDLDSYRAKAPIPESADDLQTYLRALQIGYLMAVHNYTPMAGEGRHRRESRARRPQPVVMRPAFSLRRSSALFAERQVEEERREYDDLLPALHASKRVLVLGEPGIGKTTTLFKFADELRQQALKDGKAAIPVIIPLREWREETTWDDLIRKHMGVLAARYQELRSDKRLCFLLDGLNEIPRNDGRAEKLHTLRQLLEDKASCVVTCRELDYRDEALKLDLDTITIHPLEPERVLDFLNRYLADGRADGENAATAENLFWQIAGGADVKSIWEKWRTAGWQLSQFFTAESEPARALTTADEVLSGTYRRRVELWRGTVKSPANLIHLAANPYLLWMILQVYLEAGKIPSNRGALFDEFVFQLLKGEGLSEGEMLDAEGSRLSKKLENLAWFMQRQAVRSGGSGGAEVTVARDEAIQSLGGEQELYRAASANLLEESQPVRFTHQLMQEYFAARHLLAARKDSVLSAGDLWPRDKWWQPSGWEEVAVLAVGMSGKDAATIVNWLAEANPEVAAVAIQRSGAEITDACKLRLRETWLPQMTDTVRHPEAAARAAIGRALGSVFITSGEPLDNRPGVGLMADGLPDIEWVQIPAGSVKLEGVWGTFKVRPFRIARYLVTNRQFQAFIDAPDGYSNLKWWTAIDQREAPDKPTWTEGNGPRERVSWYEAVAFCRWLTEKYRVRGLLGNTQHIRLPTEWEWQQAATNGDASNIYPWGPEWDESRANCDVRGINRTTAVGLYPHGRWSGGPLDMAGNLWEWCVNKFEKPKSRDATVIDKSDGQRVIRGGSWFDPVFLRTSDRDMGDADDRGDFIGFRLAQDLR